MFQRIILFVLPVVFCLADLARTEVPGDSLPVFETGQIVVIAERLPLIKNTSIHEISRAEIKRLDASDPAEALKYTPGIHLYTISRNETTFHLRGFEQRQVSVFFDGVPVSVPFDGKVDLSQLGGARLSAMRISRGNASALYGANTLGGSVNIISAAFNTENPLNFRVEGSSHNRYFSNLHYSNRFGKLNYAFNLAWEQADNFILSDKFDQTATENGSRRENSAFEKRSAGIKLQYLFNEAHQVGVNYHYIDNQFDVPPNSQSSFVNYWKFPDWRKNVVSLNSRHVFGSKFLLRSVLFYDSYYNLLNAYKSSDYQSLRWASYYDDYSTGAMLYPTFNLFGFGSTNSMISYKNDVHRQKMNDNPYDAYEMSTFSAGIDQDIKLSEKSGMVIGLDANYLRPVRAGGRSLRDPIWLVNGQTAFQYKYNKRLTLFASVARKSRFPTMRELYAERLATKRGWESRSNPGLKPEFAYNNEIGVRFNNRYGYLNVVLFYNVMQDLIIYRQLQANIQQMQNIGSALLRGAELDLKVTWKNIDVMFNYAYLEALDRSDDRDFDYLPYRPRHLLNFIGQWQFVSDMQVVVETSYSARQYYRNPDNSNWEELNHIALVNLKYAWQAFDFLNWYIRVNNITDSNFFSDYGVPMPGREIVSGCRLSL